jgi:Tol biopolymer transport system component
MWSTRSYLVTAVVASVATAIVAPIPVSSADPAGPERQLASSAPVGSTTMVSLRYDGAQTLQYSSNPVVSGEGRFVAFTSQARITRGLGDLAFRQVFVRDVMTGRNVLVSRARGGGAGNGHSGWASISADGTRIVFVSGATNLVGGDTNGITDVFLYDTTTGVTRLLSRAPNGNAANGASKLAYISADGTSVAYTSSATNIVRGSGELGLDNVFLHRIGAGTTELVTKAPDGTASNYYSVVGSVSADGDLVSYRSGADNLVHDDTNGSDDVFLYNASTRTNLLISRTPDGAPANANSGTNMISGDGTRVVYYSYASNLTAHDDTFLADIFLYDVASGTTSLISRGRNGGPGNRDSYYPSISGDGDVIAYTSLASNIVGDDANKNTDIFVHDVSAGSTRLISRAPDGSPATELSDRAAVSLDGTHVGYESRANNLVVGDRDGDHRPRDVFLYRRS